MGGSKKRHRRGQTGVRPRSDPTAGKSDPTGGAGSDPGLTPWVVGLILIALGVGWWWLRTPGFVVRVNPDRNILLVTIDTLRADALGSYGGRAVDAEPGSARRPRCAFRLRARARGRHAAIARHDPDGPLPVRPRHPRQHRLSAGAGTADCGDAAQGAGLRHGRLRRRLSRSTIASG